MHSGKPTNLAVLQDKLELLDYRNYNDTVRYPLLQVLQVLLSNTRNKGYSAEKM